MVHGNITSTIELVKYELKDFSLLLLINYPSS
jgi:hypothetical protein